MRLLVTGGAGYIGSHCVTELLKAQHEVSVVDNLSTGYLESLKSGVNAQASFFQEDIRNSESIKKILKDKKISGVVHFAAKLIVLDSVAQPLEYYDNNVVGSLRLLQACDEVGIKYFVFSSTATVYGDTHNTPIKESDALGPINPYGSSKLMMEQMLQDYSRAHPNFKSIILRYFNAAGASGNNGQRSANATHLIKVACQAAAGKRKSIQIFGTDWETPDKTCLRDYIHVQDLAAAHVMALNALEKNHSGGIYNCGYGRGVSVREVINMVAQVSGVNLEVQEVGRREGDPQYLVSDSQKIKSQLGWKPQMDSLEKICRSAYEWEKNI